MNNQVGNIIRRTLRQPGDRPNVLCIGCTPELLSYFSVQNLQLYVIVNEQPSMKYPNITYVQQNHNMPYWVDCDLILSFGRDQQYKMAKQMSVAYNVPLLILEIKKQQQYKVIYNTNKDHIIYNNEEIRDSWSDTTNPVLSYNFVSDISDILLNKRLST